MPGHDEIPADPNPFPRSESMWKRQPILILGVVQTALALVVSFGVGLTGEQVGAVTALAAAILSVVAQRRVTPV